MPHTHDLPATRKAALAIAAPRYQGQPCTAGHTQGRYTANKACVVCSAIADRARREGHRETEAERKREWNRANPDKRQAERQRYRESNAQAIAQRDADYRKRDPNGTLAMRADIAAAEALARREARRAKSLTTAPARKAAQRERARLKRAEELAAMTPCQHEARKAAQRDRATKRMADRPEVVRMEWRAKKGKRRAAKFGDVGNVKASEIQALFDWQDGKCAYCGDWVLMELDHKTPLSRGGSHCITNMQWLCSYHNQHKRTDTDEEYRLKNNIPKITQWE